MQGVIEALASNSVLVALVVGSITPLVVSLVQQPNLSHLWRRRIALIVSAVVGFAVAASTGALKVSDGAVDVAQLVGVFTAVWAASEAFYQKVWRPSGVAQAVEAATSKSVDEPPADEPEGMEYR